MLSQQPYLLRALYEWCVNAGYTPYLSLRVDEQTQIPPGFARNGEVTLNVHPEAVQGLEISDDWLEFSARFGGVAQRVEAPVQNVLAIYARETGEGMSFASLTEAEAAADAAHSEGEAVTPPTTIRSQKDAAQSPKGKATGKPTLRIVK